MYLEREVISTCPQARSSKHNVRRSKGNKQEGEVQRVEQYRHGFIPTEYNEDTVDPVRYLCNAGDRAPLRFNEVGISISAEAFADLIDFDF